jgi:hypothetical protein
LYVLAIVVFPDAGKPTIMYNVCSGEMDIFTIGDYIAM